MESARSSVRSGNIRGPILREGRANPARGREEECEKFGYFEEHSQAISSGKAKATVLGIVLQQ